MQAEISRHLDLAYFPLAGAPEVVPVRASPTGTVVDGMGTSVTVIPVYTDVDGRQPAFAMPLNVVNDAQRGPETSRGTEPWLVSRFAFAATTLPDGTAPNRFEVALTGCESKNFVSVSIQVGDGTPVDIGSCPGGGGVSASPREMPVPIDGTPISIRAVGGSSKTVLRVSEFQRRRLP